MMNSIPLGIHLLFFNYSSAKDTSGFHNMAIPHCTRNADFFLANWLQIFLVNTQKGDWWVMSGFCFCFLSFEEVLCGGPLVAATHSKCRGRLGHVQSGGKGDSWMIKDEERGSEVGRKGLASRGLMVRKEPPPPPTPTPHTQIPTCLNRESAAFHISFQAHHRPLWSLANHSKWGIWLTIEYSINVANHIC